MPLVLTSTTEEKVPVFLNPTTALGKPSKIEGKVKVTATTGSATWADATDQEISDYDTAGSPGLAGFVVSEDGGGVTTYSLNGDADLGSGVTSILDTIDYSYNDPNATNLGLSSGGPVPKA